MKPSVKYYLAIIALLLAIISPKNILAQYFNEGVDRSSIKWESLSSGQTKIVYPKGYEETGRKILSYQLAAKKIINHGYELPVGKFPTILHVENQISNGFVTWAPDRQELYTTPPTSTYSEPWLLQLSLHEYRHVAQLSNLNRGITRSASYFLGQQAPGMVSITVPKWYFEGDAVVAETELLTYGRGLQPDFTLAYRAYFDGKEIPFSTEKWIYGSYKDFIPGPYNLGYQVVKYGEDKYGDEMWGNILKYCGRNPFFIFPFSIGLKKYAKTSQTGIIQQTLESLKNHWDSLGYTNNNFDIINSPTKDYTTYMYPVRLGDKILSVRNSMFEAPCFVAVSANGSQEKLSRIGYISSRPEVSSKNELYWTEYRRSKFYQQSNYSEIWKLSLENPKPKMMTLNGRYYFPTPIGDDKIASGGYNDSGKVEFTLFDKDFNIIDSFVWEEILSIHSIAYNPEKKIIVAITMLDEGMGISEIDFKNHTINHITKHEHISIDNLRSMSNGFVFNSIYSGKDEIHYFDIDKKEEYRITESRYGSNSAAEWSEDEIVFTSYTKNGYRLARRSLSDDTLKALSSRNLPINILNLEHSKWNVPNFDTLDFSKYTDNNVVKKKYRKSTNLFKLHSWAPISYDPDNINERRLNFDFGVTTISQNLLSSMESSFSYGRANSKNLFLVKLKYFGLAPKFEIDYEYGGGYRLVYAPARPSVMPRKANYLSVGINTYLPIVLSSGGNTRLLKPTLNYYYSNSAIYIPEENSYDYGLDILEAKLEYYNEHIYTSSMIQPKWGYALKGTMLTTPARTDFGNLYSFYGRAYIAGFFYKHATTLKFAAQFQQNKRYNFYHKELYPTGADYDMVVAKKLYAGSAMYLLPLGYPDRGIRNIIYFKRVVIAPFYDYAHYQRAYNSKWYGVYSYGAKLSLDYNIFKLTSVALRTDITIAKPKNTEGLYISTGFEFLF